MTPGCDWECWKRIQDTHWISFNGIFQIIFRKKNFDLCLNTKEWQILNFSFLFSHPWKCPLFPGKIEGSKFKIWCETVEIFHHQHLQMFVIIICTGNAAVTMPCVWQADGEGSVLGNRETQIFLLNLSQQNECYTISLADGKW